MDLKLIESIIKERKRYWMGDIEIVRTGIMQADTDVVVNAAKEELQDGGGI